MYSFLLLTFCFITITVFLYLFRLHSRKMVYQSFLKHKHMLEETIDSFAMDMDNRQKHFESDALSVYRKYIILFRKQYQFLAHNLDLQSVNNPELLSKKMFKEINHVTKRVIGYLTSKEDVQHKTFLDLINLESNGLIDAIRKDFPNYVDDDILFIACMIAGFDNFALSSCLGHSMTATRTRKCRYKRAMLEYQGPNANRYKIWFDDDAKTN